MVFNEGHALIVGVDTYSHASRLDVPVAASDAAAVAEILSDRALCGYPEDQVVHLSGPTATRANILYWLDQLAKKTRVDDTVLLFHTGHGAYDTQDRFSLLCNDTRIQGSQVVSETGISQAELLEKAKQIPARRLLLIFNTCHSGEISPSLSLEESLGGKNLPGRVADALLATGSGRSIVTACREDQLSWLGEGNLSIFTQALVDGLRGRGVQPRGGFISLFELYTFLFEQVFDQARRVVNKPQEPELTLLKGVGPFAVALHQGASSANLGAAELPAEPPQSQGVRLVDEEQSRLAYQQIIQQSGGVNFGQGNRVKISGDVVGGDRIEAASSQGFINRPTGPVQQNFDNRIQTGGGAYVGGNVTVRGGDFVGRDQVKHAPAPKTPASKQEFFGALDQISMLVEQIVPEGKVRTLIKNDLEGIRLEAEDENPALMIMEAKLTSLQGLVKKSGGAAAALERLIEQALRLAQSLFE